MAEHRDVAVIGAGPAGLAAAGAAGAHGARVILLDTQAGAGGQVWRRDVARGTHARVRRTTMRASGVTHRFAAQVVDVDAARHTLLVETARRATELHWDRLVLATGAHELFLPFPGWTLPGVTGAGGLQALVKQAWPIAGQRVVVAGSGPLLLATAASLQAHRARVLAVFEQAPRTRVFGFARGLWRWPDKAVQALRLRLRLAGVRFAYGAVVRRALGGGCLRAVEVDCDGASERIDCDHLAAGFGLVPETGLARLLGCDLTTATHPAVCVDAQQRTSVADVFAAGECCGIGGMQKAWVEGTIAGCAAAGATAAAGRQLARRRRASAFAEALARSFTLDERTRTVADDATIVCRCEDVTRGALRGYCDARSAKLGTRCGMGPCQGRICGAAMAELAGWTWHGHPRAPLLPARLSTLAAMDTGHTAVAADVPP